MDALPQKIYRAAEVREIDRLAIEEHGIPGYTLMCRAGAAAYALLRSRWHAARNLLVLCGAGNNAGDGYVIARLALAGNLQVTTVPLSDPAGLQGDALLAWQAYRDAGGKVADWSPSLCDSADVIVDAVLGTGVTRALAGRFHEAVSAVNASAAAVFAVDIPTGLHADTGNVMGVAVRADATLTFIGLKLGLYTGAAWDHTGKIFFDSLKVDPAIAEQLPVAASRIAAAEVSQLLPARPRRMHKGNAGHVLLVGGGPGMPGAIRLAGEACLRSGAGLVTVAASPESLVPAMAGRPELMGVGVRTAADLQPFIDRASVIAIGPGLGQGDWSRLLLDAVLGCDLPLVVDADALNLLAGTAIKRDNWVLTPHPGEAGRLLRIGTSEVQNNRLGAVARLQEARGGIVVLKEAGTLVSDGGSVARVCDRGNPGMAAPGMGDLLTGVIAGIAAQRPDLFKAACAAVWVHATAGDAAARSGERGMIASDLLPWIVRQVNRT